MGWLKLGARTRTQPASATLGPENLKCTTQHIETVLISPETPHIYPRVHISVPDSELPVITPEQVSERRSAGNGGLFVVIDEIVYDCTDFILEHPGGQEVIESFAGAECSWQFWRFHGKKEMEEFGRPLRIGKTKGLKNKFIEPPKYVGLKRLGDDGWD